MAASGGIQWTHCSIAFSDLTPEERGVLKAISNGQPVDSTLGAIGKLNALKLIAQDGQKISLTEDGRVVARLC